MNLTDIKKQFLNGTISKSEYIDTMYAQHCLLFNYSEFIKSTNISHLELSDGNVIATFRDSGIKFICVKGDKRLAPWDTINFSEYEKEELEMQYRLIKPTDTIIDIGANLGWYSLHLSKTYPTSSIHSFEPIPNTFNFLIENIKLNNRTNIYAYPLGLSNQEGTFDIFYDPELSVNASLAKLIDNPKIEPIKCKLTTLDLFISLNNISHVDFIKCDIEGAELFALKGSEQTLIKYNPIVFCEMLRKWSAKFNYHPNDIIKYMAELNYMCFTISGNNLKMLSEVTDSTNETNFLFLHKVKHFSEINKYAINEFQS